MGKDITTLLGEAAADMGQTTQRCQDLQGTLSALHLRSAQGEALPRDVIAGMLRQYADALSDRVSSLHALARTLRGGDKPGNGNGRRW